MSQLLKYGLLVMHQEGSEISREMGSRLGYLVLWLVFVMLQGPSSFSVGCKTKYVFKVKEASYTRLCHTKNILTINGKFPGPTIYAHKGDTITVIVKNYGNDNITLHWHGVKQPRNPWSDGPEYITQCPIKPGHKFKYTITLSSEEGTVWWHAHNKWTRATVHGAIVVYPMANSTYPFPAFHKEYVLVIGEWWKKDMKKVYNEALDGNTPVSDAWTINGQPGNLYHCSSSGTIRIDVKHGKNYLLRVVNAGMSNGMFLAIYGHKFTIIGSDGSYLKPFVTDYLMIAVGETLDVLLEANQNPKNLYYIAIRSFAYSSDFNPNITTAILRYNKHTNDTYSKVPLLPSLPYYNDTNAAVSFSKRFRSLDDPEHPISCPREIDRRIIITTSVNSIVNSIDNTTVLRATLNNNSFVLPKIDVLEAYYERMRGYFTTDFPDHPPVYYNFTADDQPDSLLVPTTGTKVKVLKYGERIEMVFQGTSLVLAVDHPLHLHGYSFYVMGQGLGNFNAKTDPLGYNYVDPPKKNTMEVPRNGWLAVRFQANNPGVWYLHCHIERHSTWGMSTAFIVKNGENPSERILERPRRMPPC